MKEHTSIVLRIGLIVVLLFFGVKQMIDPLWGLSFLPGWLPFGEKLIIFNGLIELLLGAWLIFGYKTRLTAGLISINLLIVVLITGFNEIGVRDFGLFMASIALFLHGPDKWCLDCQEETTSKQEPSLKDFYVNTKKNDEPPSNPSVGAKPYEEQKKESTQPSSSPSNEH